MATVKNSVDIQNDIIASVYENTTEAISGQGVQDRLADMAVSYINRITDKPYLGVREFTTRGYDYLEGVIRSGIIYQCTNVLGHTGAWNPANFTILSGGATVNPTDKYLPFNNAGFFDDSYLKQTTDYITIASGKKFAGFDFSSTLGLDDPNGFELVGPYSSISHPSSGVMQFAHTGSLKFNSPIYNFSQLSASTVPYLDSSKNLISLANSAGVLTNDGIGGFSWSTVSIPTLSSVLTAGRNADATGTIKDSSSVISININNRILFHDDGTTTSVHWGIGTLVDSGFTQALHWENRETIDNTGAPSIDWSNRLLFKSDGTTTLLDWQNRAIKGSEWHYDADYSGSYTIRSLTDKAYVDAADSVLQNQINNINSGLSWKAPVRASTTANITLSGTQTIDGVAVIVGDRVLVKNQSTATENGPYVVASGSWTRATDADTGAEILQSTYGVEEGTVNAETIYTCSTDAPITIGVTSISFVKTSATTYTGSDGITLTSNNFTLNNSYFSGDVTVSAGVVAIGSAKVTNTMLAGSIDLTTKVTGILPPANGGTGVANNAASTWTISGNFATTITVTAATGVTLPTSGTLYGTKSGSITSAQMLASMSDPTGTGASMFGTAPTVTTSLTMADSANFIFNTTTGTKIGTGTTQKLAFYNSTPIVQPSGSVITALQNLGLVASATIQGAELTLSDVTTNNASTSNHGFLKKLSNAATDYMDGTGAWSVPVGTTYTAGSGLTLNTLSFANNLTVGVSGGQTIIGGTAVTDKLTYKGTTGNATTTVSAHTFVGGNNGATTLVTMLNNGNVGVGISPTARLHVANASSGANTGVVVELTVNNASTANSYIPIDFYVPTTGLIGQFLSTASNYNNSNALAANSIALFAEATSGQLLIGAIGGSGTFDIVTGGSATTNKRFSISANGAFTFAQSANTSGAVTGFNYTAPANTAQTTGSEINGILWTTTSRQWAGSTTVATQREFYITTPTYSSASATKTITDAFTFYVDAGPTQGTNTSLTRSWSAGFNGKVGITTSLYIGGLTTAATALIHLAAGTATASTAPIKLVSSGTGLTGLLATPEAGAIEFTTYGLWMTTTGAARRKILEGLVGASAPSTSALTAFVNYYGTGGTVALSTPNTWITVIGDDGNTYKIPGYS